jgi:hypothetical protein
MVAALDAVTAPTCVASSSSHERPRQTLGLTGLLERFDGRILSAGEVRHAKRPISSCTRRGPLTRPVQGARAARDGDPSALELYARPASPSSQTGRRWAGWSGAPGRPMGYRRDADLSAWRGRTWPAPARVTTEWPAVRVDARGGGAHPGRYALRCLCLAQRCELRGRVDSRAHQLAERALRRAAGGRRGEHVFGRLGRASDGTGNVRQSMSRPPRIRLHRAESASKRLQAILHGAPTGSLPAAWSTCGSSRRPSSPSK